MSKFKFGIWKSIEKAHAKSLMIWVCRWCCQFKNEMNELSESNIQCCLCLHTRNSISTKLRLFIRQTDWCTLVDVLWTFLKYMNKYLHGNSKIWCGQKHLKIHLTNSFFFNNHWIYASNHLYAPKIFVKCFCNENLHMLTLSTFQRCQELCKYGLILILMHTHARTHILN